MEPWIWIVAGIIVTALEIIIPSFTIIWFGLAAIVVGLLSYMLRTDSLAIQLVLWAILSGTFTYGWFRFFRKETKTHSGQSKDAIIGKSGIIVQTNDSTIPGGIIRFPIPVLGSDEWPYLSDDHLQLGDRGLIVDSTGDKLVVKKG
ncbi:MAG: NfeD family protein [Syntrophaceae bacterium]|nr:NfeD family protein [Syntrophaceae bacterium]